MYCNIGLFLTQSLVVWTIGIKVFLQLHSEGGAEKGLAIFTSFLASSAATVVFGEAFYRIIDLPSQQAAISVYAWLKA